MSIYNWGLNNIFMNNFIPMPPDPFGGLNPFCTGFNYSMVPFNNFNTIFPSCNSIFSSAFSPMPFSMNPSIFSTPIMPNPFNFMLPNNLFGFGGYNIPAFGELTSILYKGNNSDTESSGSGTKGVDKAFNNPQKLDKQFLNRVKEIAKKVNCNYKDLLAVMNSESSLRSNNWNGTAAVGLIQFTQVAIDELNRKYKKNLTKAKIAKMSPMEQLDWVEKLLLLSKKYTFASNARLSAADLYAITFLPGRANKEVLCREGENFYKQNRNLDENNDKKITKSDLREHLADKYVDESLFA